LLLDWIKKEFGVEYKKAQVYNIVKSLGYSYQKGRGTFPEADQGQQEDFITTIKKTSAAK
jgi:transposase